MKKKFFITVLLSVITALLFSACSVFRDYRVEFIVDGKVVQTMDTNGISVTLPADPQKTGYDFKGWYYDEGTWKKEFTLQSLLEITLTEKKTIKLYARFEKKENAFNAQFDGFTLKDGKYFISLPNAQASLDLSGKISGGAGTSWVLSADAACATVKANKTAVLGIGDNRYFVKFTLGEASTVYELSIRRKAVYTVTFDTAGGSAVAALSVEEGSAIDQGRLDEPTREGYTFAGWNADLSEPVTGDKTVTALWTGKKYTVALNADGGTLSQSEKQVTFGSPADLPVPSKKGYTFGGWYNGETLISGNWAIADNVTLKAKWTLTEFSVTYNLGGGTNAAGNPSSFTMETESAALLAPTRDGAEFAGWFTDAAYTKKIESIAKGTTSNLTLYAKWSLIEYGITYHFNGGARNGEYTFSESFTVESFAPLGEAERQDYTFMGWYASEQLTGEKIMFVIPGSTGNKQFWAKWEYGTQGIAYITNADGNYEVCGYGGKSKRLIIPSVFEGKKVVAIQNYAYGFGSPNENSIEYLEIAEGIESIGNNAFSCSAALQSIKIPSTVKSIGYQAFYGCDTLAELYFNAADCTAAGVFGLSNPSADYTGANLTVGRSVEKIPDSCFAGGDYYTFRIKNLVFEADSNLAFIGERAFMGQNFKAIELPASLKTISKLAFNCTALQTAVLPEGLEEIGEMAFYGSSFLSEVYIPLSVGYVDSEAFASCPLLILYLEAAEVPAYWHTNWNAGQNVVVPDYKNNNVATDGFEYVIANGLRYKLDGGGAVFVKQPASAERIVIPASIVYKGNTVSVVGIATDAFKDTQTVKEVTLPSTVTEIPANLFNSCKSLERVDLGGSVTKIGSRAFFWCDKLVEVRGAQSVTEAGSGAFEWCYALESASFPALKTVPDSMFDQCKMLSRVTLSPSLEKVLGRAFSGTVLTEFDFVQTLSEIGSYAFQGTKLTAVRLPDGLTVLGYSAFSDCGMLAEVTLPAGLKVLESMVFRGAAVTSIVLPEGIEEIQSSAFEYCYSLTEITLPQSLKTIGYSAFDGCRKLKSINLQYVQSIGNRAFMNCTALESVVFGVDTEKILSEAFYGCTALKSVLLGDNIQLIGSGAFDKCPALTVYATDDSGKNWKLFTSYNQQSQVVWQCVFDEAVSYVVSFTKTYRIDLRGRPLGEPYRDGYTFGGWYKNPAFTGAQVTDAAGVSDGTILFAKWVSA